MYQRHVTDIMLGHETQGIKDISIKRKRERERCSNAFSRTSLERQAPYHIKSKAFAYGNFYYSSYQKDRKKTAFRFSQEKNDFQITTFESSGEGMTYL